MSRYSPWSCSRLEFWWTRKATPTQTSPPPRDASRLPARVVAVIAPDTRADKGLEHFREAYHLKSKYERQLQVRIQTF